jgi:hypothetical protein
MARISLGASGLLGKLEFDAVKRRLGHACLLTGAPTTLVVRSRLARGVLDLAQF